MSTKDNKKETQNKRNTKVKIDSTNPFNKGVSYEMFLENVKGDVTVDSLLEKHKLTEGQKNFIKRELDIYKIKK